MVRSIRRFLLINLLLSIVVSTTLTGVGNYILDQKDIEDHLDALLSQSGLALQAVIGDETTPADLRDIQKKLNTVPKLAQEFYETLQNPFPYHYENKFQYQVLDKQGNLLIHSSTSPTQPLSTGKIGFNDVDINNETWRVFTISSFKKDVTIVVAERYDIRSELGHRIARDDFYIMISIYPFLGLLIWIIIGKGLTPLKKIASEVSHRVPSYLDPVDLRSVPVEIKPLIDELNKLFLRLQRAFDREKRFAGDAAHELKTPLAALKTQAEVALRVTDEEERVKLLKNLISTVDRSTHIVSQLLTLSRIVPEESHQLQDIKPVNLHHLVVEEMAQIAPIAIANHVELELHAPQERLMVEGNVTALSILLRNLLDNAIRYSPANSTVSVTIAKRGELYALIVADNGPGIPVELRSRVFERFYRVLGTKQTGSGLGLAIVQQIAMLHQAEVTLGTPASGQGLEVTIVFPRHMQHQFK